MSRSGPRSTIASRVPICDRGRSPPRIGDYLLGRGAARAGDAHTSLGDFDAAEEATHEAFAIAAQQWPTMGIPAKPYAWLVSVGRFRMIDRWRRQMRVERGIEDRCDFAPDAVMLEVREQIQDDELRLIFTCCHPKLTPDARIALTLREVAGLTTEEIARAYLVATRTIAQRIVRAKAIIRDKGIGYEVPGRREITARLGSVLQTIYLVFNEGYAATYGPDLVRLELCLEALRLGELVAELLDDSEALGLLALMLLHEARRATRADASGDVVLLEHQDRSQWDSNLTERAFGLILRALGHRRIGPYLLQALIAEGACPRAQPTGNQLGQDRRTL